MLNQQMSSSSPLELKAYDYWFDNLRPVLKNFNLNYHTDRELNRTIVEIINHMDSIIAANKYSQIPDIYAPLLEEVNDRYYFTEGPIKNGSDEEKNKVKELIEKFNDFSLILQYEKDPESEKKEFQRLNYDEDRHINLDDISNRGPKENKPRIPNGIPKQKYNY